MLVSMNMRSVVNRVESMNYQRLLCGRYVLTSSVRRLPVASHSRSGSGGSLAAVGVDGVRLKAIA